MTTNPPGLLLPFHPRAYYSPEIIITLKVYYCFKFIIRINASLFGCRSVAKFVIFVFTNMYFNE